MRTYTIEVTGLERRQWSTNLATITDRYKAPSVKRAKEVARCHAENRGIRVLGMKTLKTLPFIPIV